MQRPMSSENDSRPHYYQLAITLGALTAMGPLGVDMYLPALPTIAREFGAGKARHQCVRAGVQLGVDGLHRQMQHQFMAMALGGHGLPGKVVGIAEVGKRERRGQHARRWALCARSG